MCFLCFGICGFRVLEYLKNGKKCHFAWDAEKNGERCFMEPQKVSFWSGGAKIGGSIPILNSVRFGVGCIISTCFPLRKVMFSICRSVAVFVGAIWIMLGGMFFKDSGIAQFLSQYTPSCLALTKYCAVSVLPPLRPHVLFFTHQTGMNQQIWRGDPLWSGNPVMALSQGTPFPGCKYHSFYRPKGTGSVPVLAFLFFAHQFISYRWKSYVFVCFCIYGCFGSVTSETHCEVVMSFRPFVRMSVLFNRWTFWTKFCGMVPHNLGPHF